MRLKAGGNQFNIVLVLVTKVLLEQVHKFIGRLLQGFQGEKGEPGDRGLPGVDGMIGSPGMPGPPVCDTFLDKKISR